MSTMKDLATKFVGSIPCLSRWLQFPHLARQSHRFLEETVSHQERLTACYLKKLQSILRFDHCFRVPSDMDSAIGGTLTILSAGRPISIWCYGLTSLEGRHRKSVAA